MFNKCRALIPLALSAAVLGCQATLPELRQAVMPADTAATGTALDQTAADQGTIALQIHWPVRVQSIPQSANLLVITLYDALGNVKNQTQVSRPTSGDLISVVNITLPATRHLTIWARAYRETSLANAAAVPVAVGDVTNVNVYDNAVTAASLNLDYLPVNWAGVSPISPNNGGVGTLVTLSGTGFNGFVDPNNATPSFAVRFTHQTVLEGNIPNFPIVSEPSAGTDLWIAATAATRSSDTKVTALVPTGAVTGPVDYQVDGISAQAASQPVFTVLATISLKPKTDPSLQLATPTGAIALLPSQVEPLTALATDTVGSAFANPTVTWSSDNQAIAVVDGNGNVTARTPGIAHIAAQTGDLTAAVTLSVVNPGATASFTVPFGPYGGTTSVSVPFPAFNAGTLNGTASP
ncbi:MAG: Ig-like domain-containing protein [Cyanobacteria bacterium REEB65]|nr:Ig-like domain-containing protein [Cyanobacteria bacterium REEB65]